MNYVKLVCILAFNVALCGCGDDAIPADPEVRDYSAFFTPLAQQPVYPQDNPYSAEKEALGELLFWDPILSGDQNVACASCHHPAFGWADGRALSVGSDGIGIGPDRFGSQITSIHSPSLLNLAFTGASIGTPGETFVSGGYFWDLRAETLEKQVNGPIENPVEMLGYNVSAEQIKDEILLRLNAIPEYVERFRQAFDEDQPITSDNIAKAIATFERKLISGQSPFDRFLSGDRQAFSERQVVGLNKFIDGGCVRCHRGPLLSDNLIHEGEVIVGDKAVRTPNLRNLSSTAPYMHDGSRNTLADAISAYDERGDLNLTVGEGDFGDLEVFLSTLNNTDFYRRIPESVPSGLPVGGDIN